MGFRKGSKVEVLTKNEVPTGAWRCAEIISGNGHTYSVKYGWFPITGESSAAVERVPRKAIRPCPPPVNGDDNWISGDVVEVFCELCWKPAVIVKVSGGNNFSVRILGSSSELEAHRSRLRIRQSWEDGNWFLVGKGSSNLTGPQKRKRSALGLSDQKKRVFEKGSSGVQRIIIRLPSPASEKRIIEVMRTLMWKGDFEKKKVTFPLVWNCGTISIGQNCMPIRKLLGHCMLLGL